MSALISIGVNPDGGYWFSVTDGAGEWFAGGSAMELDFLVEVDVFNAVKALEEAGWSAAIPVDEAPPLDRAEGEAILRRDSPTTHPDGTPLSAMERWALSHAPEVNATGVSRSL